MKLAYSQEAIADLIRLREFIATKNPKAATKIATSICQGITQLKKFPYLGVAVAQAPDPEIIRDLIIGQYIVRYLIHPKQLYILRIWHHKEQRV